MPGEEVTLYDTMQWPFVYIKLNRPCRKFLSKRRGEWRKSWKGEDTQKGGSQIKGGSDPAPNCALSTGLKFRHSTVNKLAKDGQNGKHIV